MKDTGYACAACQKPVLVVKYLVVKRCECKAAIIASMGARLVGRGGLAEARDGRAS